MFCENCGKELEANAAYCMFCGSRIGGSDGHAEVGEMPQENPGPGMNCAVENSATRNQVKKRPIKRFVFIFVVAVAAAAGCITGFKLYNSPSAQMNRAIQAGDMELAYEIFDGNFSAKDLSSKSIELLKSTVEQVQEDFLSGAITYEEAAGILEYINLFESDEIADILSEVSNIIETQYQITSKLEAAEAYYQNGENEAAMAAYETVLSLDPSNADAVNGLEKAKLAYRDAVLEAAEYYAGQGDFDSAAGVITVAMECYFEDDEVLTEALEALYDSQIEQIIQEVYAAADNGDWSEALELLDTYQTQFPDNQSLADTWKDIVKRMPVTLDDLTIVNSENVWTLDHSQDEWEITCDHWGNIYDVVVNYDCSMGGFALYDLDGAYTAFSGTLFVPKVTDSGKDMSLSIYLDEELVYYKDGITEETAPFSFELDVTDAKTMRIVTENQGSFSSGYIAFANTNFSKAEE